MSLHGRRRAALLAGIVITALAAAAIRTLAAGPAADPAARYRVGGANAPATTLAPTSASIPAITHKVFRPAPAAVAFARTLTLPQQVAQLFLVSVDGPTAADVSALAPPGVGGVVLTSADFQSDGQVGSLAAEIAAAVRSAGAPTPLIAATQEGGPQSALPDLPPQSEAAIGAGADVTQDAAIAKAQALDAAQALQPLHVNMTIAPLADVDTPNGPLSGRLFGTDPHTVATLAAAAVAGYAQGKLIDAVGHFPGTGAASADPDQISATVGGSLAQLEHRDLIPFQAVIPHAPVIELSNASYTAFDGVTPASLLRQTVVLLRHTYGYIRVVMSDDLDATLNVTGKSSGRAALQALEAGVDLLYITGPATEHLHAYDAILRAAQRSPRISALVHAALLHDLTLKADYGLLP